MGGDAGWEATPGSLGAVTAGPASTAATTAAAGRGSGATLTLLLPLLTAATAGVASETVLVRVTEAEAGEGSVSRGVSGPRRASMQLAAQRASSRPSRPCRPVLDTAEGAAAWLALGCSGSGELAAAVTAITVGRAPLMADTSSVSVTGSEEVVVALVVRTVVVNAGVDEEGEEERSGEALAAEASFSVVLATRAAATMPATTTLHEHEQRHATSEAYT